MAMISLRADMSGRELNNNFKGNMDGIPNIQASTMPAHYKEQYKQYVPIQTFTPSERQVERLAYESGNIKKQVPIFKEYLRRKGEIVLANSQMQEEAMRYYAKMAGISFNVMRGQHRMVDQLGNIAMQMKVQSEETRGAMDAYSRGSTRGYSLI